MFESLRAHLPFVAIDPSADGRQGPDPATSGHPSGMKVTAPVTGLKIQQTQLVDSSRVTNSPKRSFSALTSRRRPASRIKRVSAGQRIELPTLGRRSTFRHGGVKADA